MHFLEFAITHFFGFLSPGPGFLLVATNSAEYGKKNGIVTSIGLNIAYTVHVITITSLIKNHIEITQLIINIISILGSLLLFYLAWKSFNNKDLKRLQNIKDLEHTYLKISKLKVFASSFFVGLLNTKSLLLILFLLKTFTNETNILYYCIWIPTSLFFYHILMTKMFTSKAIRSAFIKNISPINKVFGMLLLLFGIKIMTNIKF